MTNLLPLSNKLNRNGFSTRIIEGNRPNVNVMQTLLEITAQSGKLKIKLYLQIFQYFRKAIAVEISSNHFLRFSLVFEMPNRTDDFLKPIFLENVTK